MPMLKPITVYIPKCESTSGHGPFHQGVFSEDCVPRNCVDSSSSSIVTSMVVRQVYWSKNAVVCLRDGVMCLVWRFVDIQQSQLLETHFRAQIRSTYVTQEGEVFNNYMRWVVG